MEYSFLLGQPWLALTPYKGGASPIVLYLLIGFAVLAMIAASVVFVLSRYKFVEFEHICQRARLTREEVGFLKDFLGRFHIDKQIEPLTDIRYFDAFVNRVAHHYESAHLSEEDLLREMTELRSIRTKLGLTHDFKDKPLKTSRAIPEGHPLSITYHDSETNNSFSFSSTVIHNNDFFLGIEPPPADISTYVFNHDKPAIQVSFARTIDAEYVFDSVVVRPVNHPETMWYVRHAKRLIRGETQKMLLIPATIMFTKENHTHEFEEFAITIKTLNNRDVTFTLRDPTDTLEPDTGILLNFEAEGKSFAWGGLITDTIHHHTELVYRAEFRSVPDEDNLIMLKFLRQVDKDKEHS